jgi:hypothetical protein
MLLNGGTHAQTFDIMVFYTLPVSEYIAPQKNHK